MKNNDKDNDKDNYKEGYNEVDDGSKNQKTTSEMISETILNGDKKYDDEGNDSDDNELILRDLFFIKTGLELFEESNIKTNLLLKNAFSGLPYHSWYQWNPDHCILMNPSLNPNRFDQIYFITINTTSIKKYNDIPKQIIEWIANQKPEFLTLEQSSYLHLHVEFYNHIDIPKLLNLKWNRCATPYRFEINNEHHNEHENEYIFYSYLFHSSKSFKDDFLGKQQDLMTSHETKKYIKRKIRPIHLQQHMLIAYEKYHAKWFFKEGFYIAPSSIYSSHSRYGLFSLGYIPPGKLLFTFGCQELLKPKEFEELSFHVKLKLEHYVFEARFLLHEHNSKRKDKNDTDVKQEDEYIDYIFNPTNTNHEMNISDMMKYPNCGPWINEPPKGKISNTVMQPFTYFNIPLDQPKNRYVLFVRSAKTILPHEEIFLHYDSNYCRKSYQPGDKCPDLLIK